MFLLNRKLKRVKIKWDDRERERGLDLQIRVTGRTRTLDQGAARTRPLYTGAPQDRNSYHQLDQKNKVLILRKSILNN